MTRVADVTLRSPTLDDVPAAVTVINAEAQRLHGRDDVDEAAVRGWWTQPAPFDLETDVVLAERGGEVVGYGDLGDQANDGTILWLDARGDAREEVVAELERRALARRAAGGAIRAVIDAEDDPMARVLEERGYERIRTSYRMDGAPAGVAICRPAQHGDPNSGWISELGVLPEHRRRGLAAALLTHAFAELARRGRVRARLGVDAESTTGAVRLYERVGMSVVERSDIWEHRR